jgi:hypothetical protein
MIGGAVSNEIDDQVVKEVHEGNVFEQGMSHEGCRHLREVITDLVPVSTAERALILSWTLTIMNIMGSMWVYHEKSDESRIWLTNHENYCPTGGFPPLTWEMQTTRVGRNKLKLKMEAEWDTSKEP